MAKVLILEEVRVDSAFTEFECDMNQAAFQDNANIRPDKNFWGEFFRFHGCMEAKRVTLGDYRKEIAFRDGHTYVLVHHGWNARQSWEIVDYKGLALIVNYPGGRGAMNGMAVLKVTADQWDLCIGVPPHHGHGQNVLHKYRGDNQSFEKDRVM